MPLNGHMRTTMISGLVLVAAGLFLLLKGVSYTREESVLKVGGFEAKVQEEHSVPQWVGGVALGAGIVLVVLGFRKR
jgi:hypothetical protein